MIVSVSSQELIKKKTLRASSSKKEGDSKNVVGEEKMKQKKVYCKAVGVVFLLLLGSISALAAPVDYTSLSSILSEANNEECRLLQCSSILTGCEADASDAIGDPLSGGSKLDQYQIYADCWITAESKTTHLAQAFTPAKEYVDFVQLKLFRNFTSIDVDMCFSIYDTVDDQPGSPIQDGTSRIYSSQEFWYTAEWMPDPYADCPWQTIEFAHHPHVQKDEMYWIVLEQLMPLPEGDHIWLAGEYYDGDQYPLGCVASYSSAYQWTLLSQADFMFKTYGYTSDTNDPTADPGGPYYGYKGGGETIQFHGEHSHDNDDGGEKIVRYDWKFFAQDQWHIDCGPTPTYTYGQSGEYLCSLRVYDDEGATHTASTMVTLFEPGPPHVTTVESFYADGSIASERRGLLLQGMNLTNTYTAYITGAEVDRVEFTFGFLPPGMQQQIDTDGSDGWTASLNTNHILDSQQTLQLRAHNHHGWGPLYELSPRIVPLAGWMVQFFEYVCMYNETDCISFSQGIKDFPPKPKNNFWVLEASVDFSTGSPDDPSESPVNAGVDVPVDDVGGEYSFSGGVGSSLRISSDGVVDVSGYFEAAVEVKSINGSIGASLHGSLLLEDKVVWEYMYLTVYGEVSIPVFYIPLEVCGIGVEAGVDITPHVEVTIHLDPSCSPDQGIVSGLGIKIKDDGGIQGTVGALVRAYAEAGFVIGDFYTEAGGDGTLYFETPSPPGYFKDFVLSCWIGGRLRFLSWTLEGWWKYEWQASQHLRGSSKQYIEQNWTVLERDYAHPDSGSYAAFVWNQSGTMVVQNVYPYAHPCVASFPGSAGTKVMLVWAHDDITKPLLQGMELQYALWDEHTGMSAPQKIPATDDTLMQMEPSICFDQNGNALCVCTQLSQDVTPTMPFAEIGRSTEIAYALWNHTTKQWSDMVLLTHNTEMDVCPQIQSNTNGDLALVWTVDADGNYATMGDRSISTCFWDGTSWSPPRTVTAQQPILSAPSQAINDQGEVICVFSCDTDENLTTPQDQEIYAVVFSKNSIIRSQWKVTDDPLFQHASPSAVYGTDQTPYVVYVQNKHLSSQQQELHQATLYYQSLASHRSTPHCIATGMISDPTTIQMQGTIREDPYTFAVGWCDGSTAQTLHCAKIYPDQTVDQGIIYSEDQKLSQVYWNIDAGCISAAAVERPTLRYHQKHCNLSFITSHGFDTCSPQTTCTLSGTRIGQGEHGPLYQDRVIIALSACDQGGSRVDSIFYQINAGAWEPYQGLPVVITEPKPYIIRYYAVDKAGNKEGVNVSYCEILFSRKPYCPLEPIGPSEGKTGESHKYFSHTHDADGDQLWYQWHWGNEIGDWIGPYPSGALCIATHSWDTKGEYGVKVRAKDSYDMKSNWSEELPVSMPTPRWHRSPALVFSAYGRGLLKASYSSGSIK